MSKKSIQLLEVIAQYDNQKFKNKVVNINFPDIDENSFKGFRVVPTARRDIPDKPIVLDENSSKLMVPHLQIAKIFIHHLPFAPPSSLTISMNCTTCLLFPKNSHLATVRE